MYINLTILLVANKIIMSTKVFQPATFHLNDKKTSH